MTVCRAAVPQSPLRGTVPARPYRSRTENELATTEAKRDTAPLSHRGGPEGSEGGVLEDADG